MHMNEQVSDFINNAPAGQREIMEVVRKIIHGTVKGVQEEYKWSRPVFRKGSDFAYFKTAKGYVTIGFFQSQILDDPNGLLEGTGKDMRHIKIRKPEDVNPELLERWLRILTG
jgi:hypothetical protein